MLILSPDETNRLCCDNKMVIWELATDFVVSCVKCRKELIDEHNEMFVGDQTRDSGVYLKYVKTNMTINKNCSY
jgi:hypothetical protein